MPVQVDAVVSEVTWEAEAVGPAPPAGAGDERNLRLQLADIRRDQRRLAAEGFDD